MAQVSRRLHVYATLGLAPDDFASVQYRKRLLKACEMNVDPASKFIKYTKYIFTFIPKSIQNMLAELQLHLFQFNLEAQ